MNMMIIKYLCELFLQDIKKTSVRIFCEELGTTWPLTIEIQELNYIDLTSAVIRLHVDTISKNEFFLTLKK